MSAPPFRLSGQGIEDHAVGYHDTDDLAHIHLEGGAHHGGGHGHHALYRIVPIITLPMDALFTDAPPIGMAATAGMAIQKGPLYSCMKPKPCSYTRIPTAPSQVDMITEISRILSTLMPAARAKAGLEARSGHGGAGLGAQERPHQHGQQHEEQQRAGGDHQIDADAVQVDGQNVGQRLVIIALQRNDGTQTAGGEAPHHGRVLVRQQQPHHAHEGHGREAHVGGDHHLAALDLVEQPTIAAAEQQGKGRGDEDGHQEAGKPRDSPARWTAWHPAVRTRYPAAGRSSGRSRSVPWAPWPAPSRRSS